MAWPRKRPIRSGLPGEGASSSASPLSPETGSAASWVRAGLSLPAWYSTGRPGRFSRACIPRWPRSIRGVALSSASTGPKRRGRIASITTTGAIGTGLADSSSVRPVCLISAGSRKRRRSSGRGSSTVRAIRQWAWCTTTGTWRRGACTSLTLGGSMGSRGRSARTSTLRRLRQTGSGSGVVTSLAYDPMP